MAKRSFFTSILFILVLAGLGSIVYWFNSTTTVVPVFQFDTVAERRVGHGVIRIPIPNKGYQHVSVAFDQDGDIYQLTVKRDRTREKQISHQPHARVVNVLVSDETGKFKREVPLRRRDGRLLRYFCEFLTISPSGKHWWTARRPYESPKDLQTGSNPNAVIATYEKSGKALQEWTLPISIGEIYLVQAVGEDQVFIVSRYPNKVWICRRGSDLPRESSYPQNWFPGIGASLITTEGQFWCLYFREDDTGEVRFAQLDQPSRVVTTFKWYRSGGLPFLFWTDAQAGLFVFTNLYEYVPANTPPRRIKINGAKAVYRIANNGVVQKLFETPDVLQQRLGYQVRAGQPLKADDHYVWLEAEYLKGGKVTEYQIVKVKYQ